MGSVISLDEKFWERVASGGDYSPTCGDYGLLLQQAVHKKRARDIEGARQKFGGYTYAQWQVLLEE